MAPGLMVLAIILFMGVLTAALLSVILGKAAAAQNVGTVGALGAGGYIALAGLWSTPVSGVLTPGRLAAKAKLSHDIDHGTMASSRLERPGHDGG